MTKIVRSGIMSVRLYASWIYVRRCSFCEYCFVLCCVVFCFHEINRPHLIRGFYFFRCEYTYRYYPRCCYCMVACSVVEYSKPPSTSVRFTKIGEVSSLVERPSFTDTFELRRLDMIHFGSVAIIIDLTFTFVPAKNFRKDINTLIKFVLDAM